MKNTINRSFSVFIVFLLSFSVINISLNTKALALSGSDFQAGRIIDDHIFFDGNGMSLQSIQEFLNSKVPSCDTYGTKIYSGTTTRAQYGASRGNPAPYTCLKDFRQNTTSKPAESGLCNGYGATNQSAAEIIFSVGKSCGINPKVLLVLLQKEQSLLTDDWPWSIQYRSATGYACPDTAPCDTQYYGFFNQVYSAARQFKYYSKNASLFNYKAQRNNFVLYNPNNACGGSTVFIQNQATAGLYNYTPYQPNASALNNLYGSGDSCGAYGNRNFWRLWNEWFGPSIGWFCSFDPATKATSNVRFSKTGQKIDYASFLLYTGTSTNCIESHTWRAGFNSWRSNVASNQKTTSFITSDVQYGDLNGDGIDEPILIGKSGTGSGKVEFHIWSVSMKQWQKHIASNQRVINPANSTIDFADINGDGKDEAVLIGLNGTGSGKVEFHIWNSGMNSWQTHITSNQRVINPANSNVQFADTNGDNKDEAVLIGLRFTGSGNIEFHTWNHGMGSWNSNISSNQKILY